MAKIITLKDHKTNELAYPQTVSDAVYMDNGSTLEQYKESVSRQLANYPNVTVTGTVTNLPDNEDIRETEQHTLQLADRNNLEGMGYVILRKNKSFAEQVAEGNTIYEIRYDFDLGEELVELPENIVLKFVGGSISGGVLLVNNNTKIIGDGQINLSHDAYYTMYSQAGDPISIYSPIIVNGVSDVRISGIKISNAVEGEHNDGVWCRGMRGAECDDIVIENCVFENCGVGFFCGTNCSKVINCQFEGDCTHVFSNETLYDSEGRDTDNPEYNGYKCCKNNIFSKNVVKNTHHFSSSDSGYHLLWCSGIDGLTISDNYFESYYPLLYLYVGDLNVYLSGARIFNNTFCLKDDDSTAALSLLSVCGLSWPYQNHIQGVIPSGGTPLTYWKTDVVIENNTFVSEYKNYTSKKRSCSAVQCAFMDNVLIKHNTIDGFSNPILLQNERGLDGVKCSRYMGDYTIDGNTIRNSCDYPITFANYMKYCLVRRNTFENCNYTGTTYWTSGFFNLVGKINIQLIENEFLNEAQNCGSYPSVLFINVAAGSGPNGNPIASDIKYTTCVTACRSKDNIIAGHLVDPITRIVCSYGNYSLGSRSRYSDSEVWITEDLTSSIGPYNESQRVINLGDNKLYICTKSGLYGGGSHSATVNAASVGDDKLVVPSGETDILPSDTLLVSGAEYKVKGVFNHCEYVDGSKDYRTMAPGYPRLEIILDRPLSSAVAANTEVTTQNAVLTEIGQ